MALKKIIDWFEDSNNYKRDENKIYLDIIRTPEDLDIIVELSNLKDEESKQFYKKMEDDLEYRYNGKLINMNSNYDKCNFACRFSNDDKIHFFIIKLGEIPIGEIYTYESAGGTYFNILIKKEFRHKGYGKRAIKELFNVAFLYNHDLENCSTLFFDTIKKYDNVGEFIIKCGFNLDTEFSSGHRRLKYTKSDYNKLQIKEFKLLNQNEYSLYIKENPKTKFPSSYNKLRNRVNKDRKYNYLFLYKEDKLIGIGKVLKKNKIYSNCIWIEIHTNYRKNQYGTMFIKDIIHNLVGEDFPYISLITKYNDEISNKLIEKSIGEYRPEKIYILKRIIYNTTFLYD